MFMGFRAILVIFAVSGSYWDSSREKVRPEKVNEVQVKLRTFVRLIAVIDDTVLIQNGKTLKMAIKKCFA